MPWAVCTYAGTTHHSETRKLSSSPRQMNPRATPHAAPPQNSSYTSSSAGPSSIQAVTAPLTPPPEAATSNARAAGQAQPRSRIPRWMTSISQGSAA